MGDGQAPDSPLAATGDATATALGLSVVSREKADTLVDEQIRLIRLQADDLIREDRIRHWSVRVRHINDVFKVVFAVSVALIGLLAATGLGWLVFDASHARGLVVEPLRAPPDFAARGLDGTMLSQRLLDKLNALAARAETTSFFNAADISGSWGNDSKVAIPETGVSVSELSRELRQWLGHETHISGEVWRMGTDIAISVRSGNNEGLTFSGSEADLDKTLDRAALALFAEAQPLRYGCLFTLSNPAKADVIFRQQVARTSGTDNAIARAYLGMVLGIEGRDREALGIGNPAEFAENPSAYTMRENANFALGHGEATVRDLIVQLDQFRSGHTGDMPPRWATALRVDSELWLDELKGAFADAVQGDKRLADVPEWNFDQVGWAELASDAARAHDLGLARSVLAKHRGETSASAVLNELSIQYTMPVFFAVKAEEADWAGGAQELALADRSALASGTLNDARHSLIWPWLAYAWAGSGRTKDADALIALTPLDCTLCLEMRGRIAELAHRDASAAAWFARAANDAPSMPFALSDWGAMLLREGDHDGAIAKFEEAHEKGPHFADPLELWGEALMLKNRSDLALAKFEEADKYAPRWGRLHLEWGEALRWAGDRAGARRQFAIASGLDLSVQDAAALKKLSAHV